MCGNAVTDLNFALFDNRYNLLITYDENSTRQGIHQENVACSQDLYSAQKFDDNDIVYIHCFSITQILSQNIKRLKGVNAVKKTFSE